MKKQRAFRPVLDDGRLEDRVVMAAGPWWHAAIVAPIPRVPTTSTTAVSNVGVAIYQAYGRAVTQQVQLTIQLRTALGPNFDPANPTQAQVNSIQAAVNRTVTVGTNLHTGLYAAARVLPFGVTNSANQPSLYSQLTDPETSYLGAITTFFQPDGQTVVVTQENAAEVLGNLGVLALGQDITGEATMDPVLTLGNANVQSQFILAQFVQTGKDAGDFNVITPGAHRPVRPVHPFLGWRF